MKLLLRFSYSISLLFILFIFTNCERVIVDGPDPNNITPQPDAEEFLQDLPDLSMLRGLLAETGLDGFLSTQGPFTLFAPTNEAFQQLIDDNEAWNSIDDVPETLLKSVLSYHLLDKRVRLKDTLVAFVETNSATTIGPKASLFIKSEGSIRLNGERSVVLPDVQLSNGIIHVVEDVILPPSIVTLVEANPKLTSLVEALTRDDLSTDFVELLNGTGPFTLFAPTDSAFMELLATNPEWLDVKGIPVEILEDVLKYHVNGMDNLRADDLTNELEVATLLDNQTLTLSLIHI